MRLHELKAFLAEKDKNLIHFPILKKVKFTYSDIVKSMVESIIDHDMSFAQAWRYEIVTGSKFYHQPVREIIAAEGKTLLNILSELEDKNLITNENYYRQPFDLELERELGLCE